MPKRRRGLAPVLLCGALAALTLGCSGAPSKLTVTQPLTYTNQVRRGETDVLSVTVRNDDATTAHALTLEVDTALFNGVSFTRAVPVPPEVHTAGERRRFTFPALAPGVEQEYELILTGQLPGEYAGAVLVEVDGTQVVDTYEAHLTVLP